jgi:hypothetical protein
LSTSWRFDPFSRTWKPKARAICQRDTKRNPTTPNCHQTLPWALFLPPLKTLEIVVEIRVAISPSVDQ